MDISIFGYKIGLEILILIGIIYLILASHTLCGCCNFYSLIEGMDDGSTMVQDLSGVVQKVQAKVQQAKNNQAQSTAGGSTDATPVTSTTTTEAFTGANINYGESSLYNINDTPVDTSSWSAQNMTVVPGQPLSAGVKAFMARPEQPIPLPEGEMLMFANTASKPECCPNTYSTSTGGACMTSGQYNWIVGRAGNNVPYSEY